MWESPGQRADTPSNSTGLSLQSHRGRPHEDGQTSLFVFPSLTAAPSCTATSCRAASPGLPSSPVSKGVTFHSMRHAFASRMIFNGMEKDDLMRVMGHESEQALAIYTHLFNRAKTDARVREVMERANG